MSAVENTAKAAVTNPLKLSPALGAALAFLGVERSLPLLHGSQGCTAFALVLMVRHFNEAIPLQTTAMSELTTILGGADNVEQAISNIRERAKPKLIGICSTALTETRGEDIVGELRETRERRTDWDDLEVIYAATPDYAGSLEEGWSRALTALVEALVPEGSGGRTERQVNVLTGCHLTPADVEHVSELVTAFGLTPIVLPDLSESLDGHVPDGHVSTSLGGTTLNAIREMSRSVLTLALGEHTRAAAEALRSRCGVPYRLFERTSGLEATDAMVAALIEASGGEPPFWVKRDRSRLIDAMLDGHFHFEGKRVAIAAEPDLLLSLSSLFAGMGASVAIAVAPSPSPALASVPASRTLVGDLEDLCLGAGAGCDLVVGNSHAEAAAESLGAPLWRAGFPVYDRLGGPQRLNVGYRGARALIFEIANILIDARGAAGHGAGGHAAGTGAMAAGSERTAGGVQHAEAQAG